MYVKWTTIGLIFMSLSVSSLKAETQTSTDSQPKKVDVEKLKKDYWASGENAKSQVIENRTYSKAGSLELSVLGGAIFGDPFLSLYNLGGQLRYHIDEMWSVSVLGWKDFSSSSGAANTFSQASGYAVSTNPPNGFYGGSVGYTPIYGKLSIFGDTIWHYDLGINLGGGVTSTSTGNDFTVFAGLGQKFYLSRHWSIALDYRLMRYDEEVPSHSSTSSNIANTNWSHVFTLSLGYLF